MQLQKPIWIVVDKATQTARVRYPGPMSEYVTWTTKRHKFRWSSEDRAWVGKLPDVNLVSFVGYLKDRGFPVRIYEFDAGRWIEYAWDSQARKIVPKQS